MKRVLITGMSGTGKSTAVSKLKERGYRAVDFDCDDWSEWVDYVASVEEVGSPVEPSRDWMWREDRVQSLLSSNDADLLFVSGCAKNMGKFCPQFDEIVLLTAPAAVIVERLANRTGNQYGKRPDEVARVLDLLVTIEPRLRKIASHEIDTSVPLDEVARRIVQIARSCFQ